MKKDYFTLPRWHWSLGPATLPLRIYVVDETTKISLIPQSELLTELIKRRGAQKSALLKEGLVATSKEGVTHCWFAVESHQDTFEIHAAFARLLKVLQPLGVTEVAVQFVDEKVSALCAKALYCFLINNVHLTDHKAQKKNLWQRIYIHAEGPSQKAACERATILARANTLTRYITLKAPNTFSPSHYRQLLRSFAKNHGLGIEEWNEERLKKMAAGAFLAVAQGSDHHQAAIVKLSYRPKEATQRIALVGKGICFDTGGHNLKPARYMYNMHEDMNGSAVVLGILQAAKESALPIAIDAWFAIAENHLSPKAYKQNDVVRALNGLTIEIVHTDAEGRMVLSDTLTMADRTRPQLIVDFATLTGSMHVALGSRMSGLFVNRPDWRYWLEEVGRASGERVVCFPAPADYDEALESKVADIKQCTLEGEADHILAVRFLSKFIEHSPWIHMDLSASRNEGGLGAALTDVTGFGVLWGAQLIDSWVKKAL